MRVRNRGRQRERDPAKDIPSESERQRVEETCGERKRERERASK